MNGFRSEINNPRRCILGKMNLKIKIWKKDKLTHLSHSMRHFLKGKNIFPMLDLLTGFTY